jgi:enterochelin esterase-like enzyme
MAAAEMLNPGSKANGAGEAAKAVNAGIKNVSAGVSMMREERIMVKFLFYSNAPLTSKLRIIFKPGVNQVTPLT